MVATSQAGNNLSSRQKPLKQAKTSFKIIFQTLGPCSPASWRGLLSFVKHVYILISESTYSYLSTFQILDMLTFYLTCWSLHFHIPQWCSFSNLSPWWRAQEPPCYMSTYFFGSFQNCPKIGLFSRLTISLQKHAFLSQPVSFSFTNKLCKGQLNNSDQSAAMFFAILVLVWKLWNQFFPFKQE